AFKKIFGSEANAPVLIDLLNAVLKPTPERRIVAVEIDNPFNDKAGPEEKLSVVDVKARDQLGRLYNIEMQMCATPAYPERVSYYWAKIYADQLGDGDDYDKLNETVSISFLNDVLFAEVADFHVAFQLRCLKHPGLLFSDRQEMHVIELPKFRKSAEDLADTLEGWCYFLKNAADMDSTALPKKMQTPAVKHAMEVLTVISKTDLEREKYLAAVRYERDHRSIVNYAEKSRKELEQTQQKLTLAEQQAETARRDAQVSRIHLCQRLLKQPLTPRDELSALSLAELEAKAKALELKLGVAEE
ncbi:MAG: PD-(D/E)XK nuclease family transposase, partial [Planctomycetes bacterium]|nr:PD-(D/E)XK nuclease family transposase [Planctomycetota bacterium]